MAPLALRHALSALMLLWPVAVWGQSIQGGAAFLYGGQSLWPGSATAIQQVSQITEPIGNDRFILIGAEAYYRRNRWLFGVNASALANKRVYDAATRTTIESSASNAHLWIGWVAWQTKRTKLYPSLGPGINAFNVNATDDSKALTTYVIDGFATDIGLTFDWLVAQAATDPRLQAGPLLSLRAGYRITTAPTPWHNDRTGTAMPSAGRFSPHGFYLTLGIGGGGFRSR
ncbi:hypothetical protein [Spirosoma utsteinense]|uniref:Outer membrane protein beta-barrel domain-containing protein n=1 Tax=Spirosoma utsteinense TaxID=2585773 RepID=A0ABR6WFY4_9BACT|nr:hypothetical protein [Spirosoma utsteinense]MBC3787987.1 hypothetical protein [Spirosoma utsteinense]MBC3794936.1 hypothetical protein [Spirosoma utsteinense]